jgi:hypothetical protein
MDIRVTVFWLVMVCNLAAWYLVMASFWINIWPSFSSLKMDAAVSSEPLVPMYQNTHRDVPEHDNPDQQFSFIINSVV